MELKISPGDKVRDMISDFEGIVVATHSYLEGCMRVTVQPKVTKDMKLPEAQTFDAPSLEVLKKGAIKRKAVKEDPGGPEKHTDVRHY